MVDEKALSDFRSRAIMSSSLSQETAEALRVSNGQFSRVSVMKVKRNRSVGWACRRAEVRVCAA